MQAGFTNGIAVRVQSGSLYAGSIWLFTTSGTITVGTTILTFTEVPGSGVLAGQTLAQARLTLFPEYFFQVPAGPNVQTMSLAGLNGLADGDYDIDIYVVCSHTGATYTLAPIGWGATSVSGTYSNFTTGSTSLTAGALFQLPTSVSAQFIMHGTLQTVAGIVRGLSLLGWTNVGAPAVMFATGQCTDITSNLTGLTVSGNFSDAIAPTSYIRARARGVS